MSQPGHPSIGDVYRLELVGGDLDGRRYWANALPETISFTHGPTGRQLRFNRTELNLSDPIRTMYRLERPTQ